MQEAAHTDGPAEGLRRKRLQLAREKPELIEFLDYAQLAETGEPLSMVFRLRPALPRARSSCQGGRPRTRRVARRTSSSSGSSDPDEPAPASGRPDLHAVTV